MLITNVFMEQSYGLSATDLYAWYMAVDTVGAVGFYNSDLTSGTFILSLTLLD
jgi:ATP adenylyltransferase/5',5'''-P-1,P-4-tetraphosphate phosphorylase II